MNPDRSWKNLMQNNPLSDRIYQPDPADFRCGRGEGQDDDLRYPYRA